MASSSAPRPDHIYQSSFQTPDIKYLFILHKSEILCCESLDQALIFLRPMGQFNWFSISRWGNFKWGIKHLSQNSKVPTWNIEINCLRLMILLSDLWNRLVRLSYILHFLVMMLVCRVVNRFGLIWFDLVSFWLVFGGFFLMVFVRLKVPQKCKNFYNF